VTIKLGQGVSFQANCKKLGALVKEAKHSKNVLELVQSTF
jgi:hypothetical protein